MKEETSIWIVLHWFPQWSELTWPFLDNRMNLHRVIVEAATALASSLPTSTAESVSAAILTTSTAGLKAEIAKTVPQSHHRDIVFAFVDRRPAKPVRFPEHIPRCFTQFQLESDVLGDALGWGQWVIQSLKDVRSVSFPASSR